MHTNSALDLMSYAELEAVFGMGHRAIWERFVRTGRLTPIRFSHKTVRFRAAQVMRLVDEVAARALSTQRPPSE